MVTSKILTLNTITIWLRICYMLNFASNCLGLDFVCEEWLIHIMIQWYYCQSMAINHWLAWKIQFFSRILFSSWRNLKRYHVKLISCSLCTNCFWNPWLVTDSKMTSSLDWEENYIFISYVVYCTPITIYITFSFDVLSKYGHKYGIKSFINRMIAGQFNSDQI